MLVAVLVGFVSAVLFTISAGMAGEELAATVWGRPDPRRKARIVVWVLAAALFGAVMFGAVMALGQMVGERFNPQV